MRDLLKLTVNNRCYKFYQVYYTYYNSFKSAVSPLKLIPFFWTLMFELKVFDVTVQTWLISISDIGRYK